MKRIMYRVGVGVGYSAVSVLLVAGCSSPGSDDSSTADNDAPSPATSSPSAPWSGDLSEVGLPVPSGADVDGLVRVGGHDLAVHCTGSGSPTVVILHGWIDQPGITSYDYYGALTDELKSEFRVCSYDRANVGDSDTVAGTQTPEMVVGDLNGLHGGHRRRRTLRAHRSIRRGYGRLGVRRGASGEGRWDRHGRRQLRRGDHARRRRHGA